MVEERIIPLDEAGARWRRSSRRTFVLLAVVNMTLLLVNGYLLLAVPGMTWMNLLMTMLGVWATWFSVDRACRVHYDLCRGFWTYRVEP